MPALDEAKMTEICAILSIGGTRTFAAKRVGCHVATIRRTERRNADFAERLRKAESATEINCLTRIQDASKKDAYWRAAAWILERFAPERYAARDPETLTPAEMRRILRAFVDFVSAELPKRYASQLDGCAERALKMLGERCDGKKTSRRRAEPPTSGPAPRHGDVQTVEG